MTDRPIIFSEPMIHGLLDSRKTQTRRLATSPLAKLAVGDRLWVRECWTDDGCCEGEALYRATAIADGLLPEEKHETRWRPSIHMPRWASRITLTVEAVRRQQLQEISDADAIAEGIAPNPVQPGTWMDYPAGTSAAGWADPRRSFQSLWESLHGVDAWAANPAVVAITFAVHRRNIDDAPQPAAQAA